jgi:hypothetical protein
VSPSDQAQGSAFAVVGHGRGRDLGVAAGIGGLIGAVIVGGGLSVSSGTISADLRSNTSGITGAAAITNIVSLTAAQYTALSSKNSTTLYIVSG